MQSTRAHILLDDLSLLLVAKSGEYLVQAAGAEAFEVEGDVGVAYGAEVGGDLLACLILRERE